jgi:hypothetical protein
MTGEMPLMEEVMFAANKSNNPLTIIGNEITPNAQPT